MKKVIVSLMTLVAFVPLKSQDHFKFDHIDPAYLKMDVCPSDSAAQAFIIFNEQSCITRYHKTTASFTDGRMNNGPEYRNEIQIHRAVKILDNEATHWGNFTFVFNKKLEKIVSVKGYTYNLDGNKIVKSKLERSQIIYEDISSTRERMKISMPQVKKGSVVEIELNLTSDNFYSLGPFPMQFTIPVEKNILMVKMFEYYNYNRIIKGYFGVSPKRSSTRVEVPITVTESTFSGRTTSQNKITYLELSEEYAMDNVPAFPLESYLTTPDNYLASIRFELAFTKFPNTPQKHFNSSWESLTKVLIEDPNFGQQLRNTGFLGELAGKLRSGSDGQAALLQACYEHIRDNITCDNKTGIFCENGIREVLKNGKGDVQGVNLLLTALVREAGLRAWPVILSTRSNGMIQPIYPSIDDFNYVICLAEADGKRILLDASDRYLTMNLLDPACLNDKGRIIDQTETGWIELTNPENSYKITTTWNVELGDDGVAHVKAEELYEDIAAYMQRDRIRDAGGFEKYIDGINHPDNGFTILSSGIENQEDKSKPVRQTMELDLDRGYKQGDLFIFLPLFTEALGENPFKLKKREYPVEFEFPATEKVVIRTKIPEGYEIESLPQGKSYNLPGGSIVYWYRITGENNEIVAEYSYQIKRMVFPTHEYENLKDLYRVITESQNESVVLKRSAE